MSCKTDRKLGLKEARQQIPVLSARWPLAFPEAKHLVRPLATNLTVQIAESMGWSNAYTRAVLAIWKQRHGYCVAVLCYTRRIDLAGDVTEHEVSDEARAAATAQLARIKAMRAARAAKRLAEADPPATQGTDSAAEAAAFCVEPVILSERDSLRVIDLLEHPPELGPRLLAAIAL